MLEVIACCLMMERNLLLPTANYQTPDEECPIDVVANQPREGKLHYVLSNSFAFGGQTSCVLSAKSRDIMARRERDEKEDVYPHRRF